MERRRSYSKSGAGSVGTGGVPKRVSKASLVRGMLAGCAVIFAGILVLVMMSRDEAPVAEPEAPEPAKAVKVRPVRPEPAEPGKADAPPERIPEKPKADPRRAALRAELKKLTPEERREVAYEMIRNRKIDLEPTTNRPFRTGIELSMARIFMTRVGNPPPPIHTTFIPIQDAAHLEEILAHGNPVLETDSDEVREAKATVEAVKKEMAQFIADGGEPGEFMAYYYDKLNSAFEERRASMREVARIATTEPEIAQEFYEQVERRLAEKGIRGLEFNEKQKARLGLE